MTARRVNAWYLGVARFRGKSDFGKLATRRNGKERAGPARSLNTQINGASADGLSYTHTYIIDAFIFVALQQRAKLCIHNNNNNNNNNNNSSSWRRVERLLQSDLRRSTCCPPFAPPAGPRSIENHHRWRGFRLEHHLPRSCREVRSCREIGLCREVMFKERMSLGVFVFVSVYARRSR